ncbi:DUF5958 family protein [Streptomyces mirabilis]|uniref:DUF5958 family protein n=1 Tax=Streptomyces mirabilis TaxID=68239 RepID=UPI0036D77821
MLYAHEVSLNELAQGLRPVADGVEWFEGLSDDDQRKALYTLVLFCGDMRAGSCEGGRCGGEHRALWHSAHSHACGDAHEMALRDGPTSGL